MFGSASWTCPRSKRSGLLGASAVIGGWRDLGELRQLVAYLRELGVMAPEQDRRTPTPLEGLIAEYRGWLVVERDLAAATVLRYEKLARRFLSQRVTATDQLGASG